MFSPIYLYIISIGFPLISLYTFKDILSPHFIYTVIWIYLLPLGAMVNPSPADDLLILWSAEHKSISSVHWFLTSFFILQFLGTYAIAINQKTKWRPVSKKRFPALALLLGVLGVLILAIQFLRQLSLSDWSFDLWIYYLLGARFDRPWTGSYIGGAEYIFTFVANLFPIAGVMLAYAFVFSRSISKWIFLFCLLFQLFILVGDGSRTPMALTLLTFGVFWWIAKKGITRYVGTGLSIAAVTVLISLMSQFRQDGLSAIRSARDAVKFEYRQDDNYFRLMQVALLDDIGTEKHWNAREFIGAAVVNPIPRYFWPGKPLLEQDFYGGWKVFYVTISFVGECIAMFGLSLGLIAALVMSLVIYWILERISRLASREGGIILYFGACFYIYSILRSISNIGMNMTFMVAICALYYFLNRKESKRTILNTRIKRTQ